MISFVKQDELGHNPQIKDRQHFSALQYVSNDWLYYGCTNIKSNLTPS